MEVTEERILEQIAEGECAVDDLLDQGVAYVDEDRLFIVVQLGPCGVIAEFRTCGRAQRIEILRVDGRLAVTRSQTHLVVRLRVASRRSTRTVRT